MRPYAPRRLLAAAVAILALLGGCSHGPSQPVATQTSRAPTLSGPIATTPPRTAAGVRLAVLGDFGYPGDTVHAMVRRIATFGRLDAVLTTGDDAYQTGTRAEAAFARGVLDPVLPRGTRLIAAIGNHDIGTDAGRPVMRALDMPARWYATSVGPVQVVVLDANRPDDPAQLRFLRRILASRPTPWRIVTFHQPAYACSFHAADPRVQRYWLPLFRGKVDLVLSGHNHTYERFTGTGRIPFITTGGGGAPLYASALSMCTGGGEVQKLNTVHHALRLDITRTHLDVSAIDVGGHLFDHLTLRH